MKQECLKTRFIWIVVCFVVCIASVGWADQARPGKPSCPHESSLTNSARKALFEAQEKMTANQNDEAREILEKFLASHPMDNHPYLAFTLGILYLDGNALGKSRTMFSKCVDMCPEFVPAWQNLGKVCYDMKDYEQAARAFDTVYDLEATPLYRFHGAVAWMEAQKKTLAFERMLLLTSGNAGTPKKEWVELLVHLAMELKRSREAIPVLETMLAQKNPPAYLLKLATGVYLEQNSYRKATQALAAYSLLQKLNIREMRLLGDLLYSQGIPLKASVWYEKVYEAQPDLKNCVRMVSALQEGFAVEKALAAVDKGICSYPDSFELWRVKAWICYGDKNFQEAAHCFSQAARLNQKDTKSLFMSGVAAYRAGQKKEAKTSLKLAAAHKAYKSQASALIRQIDYEISQKS